MFPAMKPSRVLPPVACREIAAGEIESAIALRNECFAPISPAGWRSETPMTACVATAADEVVGVLPLALRTIDLSAGRTLRTAFEHSVCTRADQRGRGIGTQMIESARGWLRERVDALFVLRTREESAGYRFYARSGHVDLCYARRHVLSLAGQVAHPVSTEEKTSVHRGIEALCADERDCLALWRSQFAGFAGHRTRDAGYYRRALTGLYFSAHPQEFLFVRVQRAEALSAFALLALPQLARDPAVISVLEFVAFDSCAARATLSAVARIAQEYDRPVHCVTGDNHPFISELKSAGFQPETRHQVLMAQLLDPTAWAPRAWRAVSALEEVRVVAWTPAGEFALQAPSRPTRTVQLEMKPEALTRLLLGRLTLSDELRIGLVTAIGLEAGDIEALDRALPVAPWCYHAIDYI